MTTVKSKSVWSRVIKAPSGEPAGRHSSPAVEDTVAAVIADIRANGDEAVRRYSERFDSWAPSSFRLSADDWVVINGTQRAIPGNKVDPERAPVTTATTDK